MNVVKNYGTSQFHDDLKTLYQQAGLGENKPPVVFLFDDTQIVIETFLEDINNILSTGEVIYIDTFNLCYYVVPCM